MNELTEVEKEFLSACLLHAGRSIGKSSLTIIESVSGKLGLDTYILDTTVEIISDEIAAKKETDYRIVTRLEVKSLFRKSFKADPEYYLIVDGYLDPVGISRAFMTADQLWRSRADFEIKEDAGQGITENDYAGWVLQELHRLTGARIKGFTK